MSSALGTGLQVVRRVAGRVEAAVVSWQDPAARHARAVRRAWATTRRWGVATAALAGATGVAIPMGGGLGGWDVAWAAAAAGAASATGFAVQRARELERQAPPPAPPGRGSAARPAVDRVEAARRALTDSLTRLGPLAGDTAAEARAGERALRELAGRITAVESALAVAPAEARAGLTEAHAVLVDQLLAGVGAYERLVAVAAECVAADVGQRDSFALRRLEAACDALAGLAAGLRDVHASGTSEAGRSGTSR